MWIFEGGIKKFSHGLSGYKHAEEAASQCGSFFPDDEDEVIDDSVSCYNCAFRRFSEETILCLKNVK